MKKDTVNETRRLMNLLEGAEFDAATSKKHQRDLESNIKDITSIIKECIKFLKSFPPTMASVWVAEEFADNLQRDFSEMKTSAKQRITPR